jgi:hypothetical protein
MFDRNKLQCKTLLDCIAVMSAIDSLTGRDIAIATHNARHAAIFHNEAVGDAFEEFADRFEFHREETREILRGNW